MLKILNQSVQFACACAAAKLSLCIYWKLLRLCASCVCHWSMFILVNAFANPIYIIQLMFEYRHHLSCATCSQVEVKAKDECDVCQCNDLLLMWSRWNGPRYLTDHWGSLSACLPGDEKSPFILTTGFFPGQPDPLTGCHDSCWPASCDTDWRTFSSNWIHPLVVMISFCN